MSAWIVEDDYTGERVIYHDKDMANDRANKMANDNHELYCVQKYMEFERHCLCVTSGNMEECAGHYYRRTVQPHSIEDCTLGIVSVQWIKIH